jgi:hypothetical protein
VGEGDDEVGEVGGSWRVGESDNGVGEGEQDKAKRGALERALIAQTGVGCHVADGTCRLHHVKVDFKVKSAWCVA